MTDILGVRFPTHSTRGANKPLSFVKGDDEVLVGMLHSFAEQNGITVQKLKYGGRNHVLVGMRQKFCLKARAFGYSFPQIGWVLGCHHSSVIYLCTKRQVA